MRFELKSIRANDVAILIPISDVPKNKKVIDTRWVFRVKSDGELKKLVLGWEQIHGISCGNIFAPVRRFDKQILLLAITAAKDWRIISLDVHTAFLNNNRSHQSKIGLFIEDERGPQ